MKKGIILGFVIVLSLFNVSANSGASTVSLSGTNNCGISFSH